MGLILSVVVACTFCSANEFAGPCLYRLRLLIEFVKVQVKNHCTEVEAFSQFSEWKYLPVITDRKHLFHTDSAIRDTYIVEKANN